MSKQNIDDEIKRIKLIIKLRNIKTKNLEQDLIILKQRKQIEELEEQLSNQRARKLPIIPKQSYSMNSNEEQTHTQGYFGNVSNKIDDKLIQLEIKQSKQNSENPNKEQLNNPKVEQSKQNGEQSKQNNGQPNKEQLNNPKVEQPKQNNGQLNNPKQNNGQPNKEQLNNPKVEQPKQNNGQLNNPKVEQPKQNNGQPNKEQLNNPKVEQSKQNNGQSSKEQLNNPKVEQPNKEQLNNPKVEQSKQNNGQPNREQLNNPKVEQSNIGLMYKTDNKLNNKSNDKTDNKLSKSCGQTSFGETGQTSKIVSALSNQVNLAKNESKPCFNCDQDKNGCKCGDICKCSYIKKWVYSCDKCKTF